MSCFPNAAAVAKRGGAPWTGCVQQGSDTPRKVLDSNGGCCYIMFLNSVKAGLFVGLVNCVNMQPQELSS